MSVSLATYLLREQLLRPDQVDDLLQLQVVLGGSLDTQILEAGVMQEDAVLAALGEAMRMPAVGAADIADISHKMPDIFPRVFAETYNMIPYRLVGRNLGVLVADIPDPTAIMKLEQRLKIRIAPAITTEVRIYHAMKQLYGAELPPRMNALLQKLDTKGPQPAEPVVASETAQVFQRELSSNMPERAEPMDLDVALVKMQMARDRDQIIDTVLSFANQAFRFAGMFVVQNKSAVGYRGRGDSHAVQRLPRVSVPLILQSMFKTIYDTQGHFLGSVPTASLNGEILNDIGREPPKIAFLAPVVIQGKVVGLLYADNGKRGVSSRKVADLLVVVTRLGGAFERLISKRKAEVKVAASAVADTAMKAAALRELTAPTPIAEPEFASIAPALPEREQFHVDEETLPAPPEPDAPIPALAQAAPVQAAPVQAAPVQAAPVQAAPVQAAPAQAAPVQAAPAQAAPGSDTKSHTNELLSQRFLNVLRAAQEEDDEDDDYEDEETIDISAISADALLGKEEAPAPHFDPPKVLAPLKVEQPAPVVQGKAFAEFDDEADEDAVSGWESVLVETIAQGKQGGNAENAADMEVEELGWEDVMVDASSIPDEKPRLDDLALLVDALESPDDDVARRATENIWQRREEFGERLVQALGARFPGRLGFDPFRNQAPLPPVAEMNAVTRLLVALAAQALPIVLPHMESQYPAHRLVAVLFFGQVVSGQAFSKLLRRLFDDEPRVREAAADALMRYSRLPGYDDGLAKIRERLSHTSLDAQMRATEILGRLRDARSVPLLIPLTNHKRPELARAAHGALIRITAQDFAQDAGRWTEWWVKNSDKPREQWLVEGLRRKEPFLRVMADEELRAISGTSFHFDPAADRKQQEPAIRAWEAWLETRRV